MKFFRRPFCSGLAAGAVNGLFGAGGGMVLVLLLRRVHGLEPKRAFATSLAVMLPLSLVSAAVYVLREGLPAGVTPYIMGGAAGGFLAGKGLQKLPVRRLQQLFGLLLLFAGLRSVLA